MSALNPHLSWIAGYTERGEASQPGTYYAEYSIRHLIDNDYIDREAGENFLTISGLDDFHWAITWPEDFELPDEMLVDRMANVQGYVFFVHGWTGNYRIWEELPAMVVNSNRQLVAFCLDHNGFGSSAFTNKTPNIEDCNPPAAMKTLENWVLLMKLRRQPGSSKTRVLNFVGHSMGGATLFYMNPLFWNYGETTRFALAPALLLEDETHRLFYSTLGLGISILQRLPVLEIVERFVKPGTLRTLAAGASDFVKQEHARQYEETPRGVTGATFMAMGRLRNYEIARNFDLMQVMLGHRDPLVGLVQMMDLLGKLEFPGSNIHVVPGTHYMFSIGTETPMNAYQHAQNREMVVQDILKLHNKAYQMQREGVRYG